MYLDIVVFQVFFLVSVKMPWALGTLVGVGLGNVHQQAVSVEEGGFALAALNGGTTGGLRGDWVKMQSVGVEVSSRLANFGAQLTLHAPAARVKRNKCEIL